MRHLHHPEGEEDQPEADQVAEHVGAIIRPSEMRAATGDERRRRGEVDEHDGEAVRGRPRRRHAPDDPQIATSSGPTSSPRRIMSRETSTSGAGPSRRVVNGRCGHRVARAGPRVGRRDVRVRRHAASFLSEERPWAAAARSATGFVFGHVGVVAVPEAGEHADRTDHDMMIMKTGLVPSSQRSGRRGRRRASTATAASKPRPSGSLVLTFLVVVRRFVGRASSIHVYADPSRSPASLRERHDGLVNACTI